MNQFRALKVYETGSSQMKQSSMIVVVSSVKMIGAFQGCSASARVGT